MTPNSGDIFVILSRLILIFPKSFLQGRAFAFFIASFLLNYGDNSPIDKIQYYQIFFVLKQSLAYNPL